MDVQSRTRTLICAALMLLVFCACDQPTPTTLQPDAEPAAGRALGVGPYVPMDLGTLGGDQSWGYAINNRGQVVGWSETADGKIHAFLWDKGTMTDLSEASVQYAQAHAINERGQVVGRSGTGHYSTRAVLWEHGTMTPLAPYVAISAATGINNRGQVVGNVQYMSPYSRHAFLWYRGEETPLGHPLGGYFMTAMDINERGQIVGHTQTPFWVHAFVWEDGMISDLGVVQPPTANPTSLSYAINSRGQVVGHANVAPGEWHAFLWDDGEMIDLGGLPYMASAQDINERGQIVGYQLFDDNGVPKQAMLWESGAATVLATLGGSYGWAQGINDPGLIAGSSQNADGNYRATLWTRRGR